LNGKSKELLVKAGGISDNQPMLNIMFGAGEVSRFTLQLLLHKNFFPYKDTLFLFTQGENISVTPKPHFYWDHRHRI
jgi:hypothetical protein